MPCPPNAITSACMVATGDFRSYEEVLLHLHGWIGRPVAVTITPRFEGAMPVAGMSGPLKRSGEPPAWLLEATGQTDEVLLFIVGDDEEWSRNWFAVARAHFKTAFVRAGAAGNEVLVIALRQANMTVALLPERDD